MENILTIVKHKDKPAVVAPTPPEVAVGSGVGGMATGEAVGAVGLVGAGSSSIWCPYTTNLHFSRTSSTVSAGMPPPQEQQATAGV